MNNLQEELIQDLIKLLSEENQYDVISDLLWDLQLLRKYGHLDEGVSYLELSAGC